MRYLCLGAALLMGAAGCGGGEKAADTTAVVAAAPDAAPDRAATAAMLADAIATNPAAADSILEAGGFTRDSFQELMYEIAADSAMSAAYAAARKP